MANVGNLKVQLTLSAQQFAAGLIAAGGNVNQFAVQVQTAQTKVVSLGRSMAAVPASAASMRSNLQNLTMLMPVAAQGAADFASQLGTRGLGGALNAAANNIQVLGAAFGPKGLAISSVIGLMVQGIGSYLEYQQRVTKGAKDMRDTNVKAMQDIANAAKMASKATEGLVSAAQLRFDVANRFGGASSQSLTDQATQLQREGVGLRAQREGLALNAEAILNPILKQVFGAGVTAKTQSLTDRNGINIGALDELIKSSPEFRKALGPERTAEVKKLADEQLGIFQKLFDNNRRLEATLKGADTAKWDEKVKADIEAAAARKQEASAIKEAFPQSNVAPGIGAFGAETSQGFAIIQAALRSAKDVKNPQLDTIGIATKKTADNTRDIAKTVKRFKVATIA